MSKKCYRFFGGFQTAQENWLNRMADKGYRLIRTGKLIYEFEECHPNQVKYRIDFIAHHSKDNALVSLQFVVSYLSLHISLRFPKSGAKKNKRIKFLKYNKISVRFQCHTEVYVFTRRK